MPKRATIPPKIQAEVLINSGRRCCVCFGLGADHELKEGQIAHLDHNPSNNKISNLAFLCLKHHDTYDSSTRLSKGLTRQEVVEYRSRLQHFIKEEHSPIERSIDFVASSIREQENVLNVVSRYWSLGNTSYSSLYAEIAVRIEKLKAFHKQIGLILSSKTLHDDKYFERQENRLKKTLGLPEEVWGLGWDGNIPNMIFSKISRLSKIWCRGKMTHAQCEELFWLIDEGIDFDQYYILYGLPHGGLGALGIVALNAFLFEFGMRSTARAQSGSRR